MLHSCYYITLVFEFFLYYSKEQTVVFPERAHSENVEHTTIHLYPSFLPRT